jgi:hypothetical protein
MRTRTESKSASDELVRWRRKQLVDSGFPLSLATRLAKDSRYDMHALIELVERGCPPDVAARIVAPLDARSPREPRCRYRPKTGAVSD